MVNGGVYDTSAPMKALQTVVIRFVTAITIVSIVITKPRNTVQCGSIYSKIFDEFLDVNLRDVPRAGRPRSDVGREIASTISNAMYWWSLAEEYFRYCQPFNEDTSSSDVTVTSEYFFPAWVLQH